MYTDSLLCVILTYYMYAEGVSILQEDLSITSLSTYHTTLAQNTFLPSLISTQTPYIMKHWFKVTTITTPYILSYFPSFFLFDYTFPLNSHLTPSLCCLADCSTHSGRLQR